MAAEGEDPHVRARRGVAAVLGAVLATATAIVGTPAAASGGGDPLRGQQWGHDLVRVEPAWSASRGQGVVIAVIDTGVALDHPDLRDRFVRTDDGLVQGLDLVDGRSPQDTHGHGTLVAGVAAATADNGEGIAGVAPRARILPIRVLDGAGNGQASDVDRAIRFAVAQGADVINLSLEAVAGTGGGPAVPHEAVVHAAEAGVVVVVSAGNNAGSASSYPADTPALLVGAVGRDGRPALADVGRTDAVLAPGIDIISTWCRRTSGGCDVAAAPYGTAEGTSFAAPYVSGIAALLVAQGLSGEEVVTRIRETAVPVAGRTPTAGGAGRVDAAAAVAGRPASAARPTSAPTEPPPVERTPAPPPEPSEPSEPAPAPPAAPAPEPEPEPAPEPEASEPEPVTPPPAPDPEPVPPPDPGPEPGPEPAPPPEPEPAAHPEPFQVPTVARPDVDGDVVAIGRPDGRGGPPPQAVAAGALLVATMALWSAAARRWEPV